MIGQFFKRHMILSQVVLWGTLGFLYLFLRLVAIRSIPPFLDELIYARWAQQGFLDPAERLVSLVDGKQPGFIWLTTLAMNIIASPIAAGRIVSVVAGMITIVGLYFLSLELFSSKKIAFASVMLYVFYPFALIHDRMALYESLVGALTVWILYVSILLVRRMRLELSFVLALLFGAGFLTKSSVAVGMYMMPLTLLLKERKELRSVKMIKRLLLYVLVAVALGLLYSCLLYLSPNQKIIAEKNTVFLYSLSEAIRFDNIVAWPGKITLYISWVTTYLTIPLVLAVGSSFILHTSHTKEKLLLFSWFLMPFAGVVIFGKTIYPRYFFPITLSLLPIIAYTIVSLKQRIQNLRLYIAVLLFIFGSLVYTDVSILRDFPRAAIPKEDLYQYINGWPAGGGIKEIVAFLSNESNAQHISVFSEGNYGSVPRTFMELYFVHNTQVRRFGFSEVTNQMPELIFEAAREEPTYIIFNQLQKTPSWPMRLIASYPKGIGEDRISLFIVDTEKSMIR